MLTIQLPRRRQPIAGVDPVIWGAVAFAWALALTLAAAGRSAHLSHDTILGGGLPALSDLVLFLVAWQAMTAGMMLPSSLPLVRLFAKASRGQDRPRLALAAFLAAYFAVWTGFAVLALGADAGVHGVTERWAWLAARPELIGGGVLILAGAFQFSPLKERCLDACRNPMHFMWRFYGRGVGPAWRFGLHHGLFCLGCCWALMTVLLVVGLMNLVWMVALALVFLAEKHWRQALRAGQAVGVGLVLLGLAVAVRPSLLPTISGNTAERAPMDDMGTMRSGSDGRMRPMPGTGKDAPPRGDMGPGTGP